MSVSKELRSATLVFSFCLLTRILMADNDPGAVALLQKVTDAYKNAPSFSCDGQYENDLQTAMPVKLMGTFKILFGRPDEIRVDWTDTQMGGQVITSSVFTQDKTIYFLFGALHKWAPEKNMEAALGTAARISHGVSYAVPSLLCGKPGYFTFSSLKPTSHALVNGKDCLVLAGATRFGETEIAIDPATYAIRQIKTTLLIKHSDIDKQVASARKELAKSNPELAAKLHDPPATPDFTSFEVTSYDNPIFSPKLAAADFVYPIPPDAKKVADVLK